MPSVHDNQVLGLPSYGPASLAFDSDGDEGSSALTASRASKGRASSLEDDKPNDRTDGDADGAWASDEDDWDAWDDGGIDTSPSRHMGDERPGVTGGRSSNDEDDEDERAMEHEMKTLALAEGDGHVASEKELRKKLYWRDAMVTGIFVLLWCVEQSRKRACGWVELRANRPAWRALSGTCSRPSSRSVPGVSATWRRTMS